MQRRQHGRRLCQGDRRTDAGQRAFRPGADQCADRHRRGGQEPDAASRAGRRRADRRGEEQLLHRAGRHGACGRCGFGAAAHARLGARGRAACGDPRAARSADRGAEHAARRAACIDRLEPAAARTAAGARPPASRPAGRRAAGRCAEPRAAPAHSCRPRRGDFRRRRRLGGAGRPCRRAAGDVGVRPRPVRAKSVVGRHQRRLFLAGRRRTDRRKRFHCRLRRKLHPVDHQKGQADRARRGGRAGRYRRAEARLSDAGAGRGARRRQGDRRGVIGQARRPRGERQNRPAERRAARAHPGRRQSSCPVYRRVRAPHSSTRAR